MVVVDSPGCAWVIWYDVYSDKPHVVARTATSPITGDECPRAPPEHIIEMVWSVQEDTKVHTEDGYLVIVTINGDDTWALVVREWTPLYEEDEEDKAGVVVW